MDTIFAKKTPRCCLFFHPKEQVQGLWSERHLQDPDPRRAESIPELIARAPLEVIAEVNGSVDINSPERVRHPVSNFSGHPLMKLRHIAGHIMRAEGDVTSCGGTASVFQFDLLVTGELTPS